MILTLAILIAFLIAPIQTAAQPRLERPVALVVDGAGSLPPGTFLFAGESVVATPPGLTIAFCSAAGDSRLLLSFATGAEVRFTPQAPVPTIGNAAFLAGIPVCLFPEIDRAALAHNVQAPPGNPSDEPLLARLGSRSPAMAQQYQAAVGMATDPRLKLVAGITQAATLDQAGLSRDAAEAWREIRDRVDGATWTRGLITRINQALLYGAPAPDLTPRVTRPAGTAGNIDSFADYKKGQTFAVLVGISAYPPGKGPDLEYADADAIAFKKFLQSERGGSVPDANIRLLVSPAKAPGQILATRDAFEAALVELIPKGVGQYNTFIVFVAGHGTYACAASEKELRSAMALAHASKNDATGGCADSEKAFIVMRDGEREAPNIAGYPMERLRDLLASHATSFGRVLMYVDVCHGGNATWPVDTELPLDSRKIVQSLKAGNGRLGILTGSEVATRSTRSLEYSYESRRLKHGVFTFYLLRGLNGEARAVGDTVPITQLHSTVALSVNQFTKQTVPGKYWVNGMLPVVDRPAAAGANLDLVEVAGEEILIQRGFGFDDFGLTRALAGGTLGRDSPADAALEKLAARYGPASSQYLDAAERYRVALENRGQEIIVRYLRGDQDPLPRSDFDRCADYFETALKLAPDAAFDESRALFCRGRAWIFRAREPDARTATERQRRYDLARAALERSIRIDPARSYAYNALGIAYLEQAAFQPAVQAFSDAIRFETKWAYPRHNLALALTEAGRYNDAAAVYRDAMNVGPQYSYLPYNLGLLYQTVRNYDDARTAYREAIRIAEKRCAVAGIPTGDACPDRALPRTGLASVFAQQSKQKSSEALYRGALDDRPADPLIVHNLASLYAGWKKHEKMAADRWTGNLTLHPEHVPSLAGYAGLLKRYCRFDEAVPLLRRLTELTPGYEPAIVDLALALSRTGDFGAARMALNRATSRSADFWAVSAEIGEASGDSAAASAAWRSAFSLVEDDARKNLDRRRKHPRACTFELEPVAK